MFKIKQKPQIPNAFGMKLNAEFAVMSGSTHYLLPGVTKQGTELAVLPVFKAGQKPSPKSLRANVSPLNVFIWYDLPLAAKKDALQALMMHFEHNVDEVVRVLGHSQKYILELPQLKSDEDEYLLATETKIENRLTTQSGVAKDPMKFFEMSDEDGHAFLQETEAAWRTRALDGHDPFVLEAVQTANKTALRFLISLGRPGLFTPEQIGVIISTSEKKRDYTLLPEICASLNFADPYLAPLLINTLFPNEDLVKKMSADQLDWRIRLLKQVESPMRPIAWYPAFKGLSLNNLVTIGAHLLTNYFIENLNFIKITTLYPSARQRGAKITADIIRADSPVVEEKAHYFALANWAQRFTAELTRHRGPFSEADAMVLLMQTAIPLLDIKHWPSFLEKSLTDERNANALVQFIFANLDNKHIGVEAFDDEKLYSSIFGRIFDNLGDNEKTGIRLYGQISRHIADFSKPEHALIRTDILKISRYFTVLIELSSAVERAQLESLPFYKVVRAIATAQPDKTEQLTPFEVKLLKGLLKTSNTFLEKFDADSLTGKALLNITTGMKKLQVILQEEQVVDARVPAAINIPPRGTLAEKQWLDVKVADFEKAARASHNEDVILTARGLRHIHTLRAAIKQKFDDSMAELRRGLDPIYVSEGVLIHLGNAKVMRLGQRVPEWSYMNDILDEILYRILTMYAIAIEWERIEGHSDKLKDFFGRMGGLCIESRTRTLLDTPPGWSIIENHAAQAAQVRRVVEVPLDDMESLRVKMTGIVLQHKTYFSKNDQSFVMADANELITAWYSGQFYRDENGSRAPINSEVIEGIVGNLDVQENAAASLLAAAAAAPALPPAGQQALQREGLFPAGHGLGQPARLDPENDWARYQ